MEICATALEFNDTHQERFYYVQNHIENYIRKRCKYLCKLEDEVDVIFWFGNNIILWYQWIFYLEYLYTIKRYIVENQ